MRAGRQQRDEEATTPTERFAARVPAGFRKALRQLLGQRMSVAGQRITEGELLMSLVQAETAATRHVERITRGGAR